MQDETQRVDFMEKFLFVSTDFQEEMLMKKLMLIGAMLFPGYVSDAQQWLKVDSVFNPSGVAVQNFSAPEFADLNADGNPDLLLGNGSSARVGYFRNIGAGVPPKFQADTSMLSSIYAGGIGGTNSDYPVTCDLDGDGDLDLLVGGYNGILFYKNVGDTLQPVWQRIDTVFTAVNTAIGSDARPAFADLDADGDFDLLVGIGESLFGGPTPGITMGFRNTGTRNQPQFVQEDGLVTGIPDIGRNSYPTLKDIDGDNDLDLLLGRDLQTFVYFRNTGTVSAPVWTVNSTTFNGMETTTYWKDPTLFDLDKDNDYDLIYGTSDGTMYYYQNTGTRTAPQFQYNPNYFPVIRISGGASTASLADFDNDGDVDMLSGDWLGGFQYFRNDGTPTAPRFTKTTSSFTSLNVSSYSTPVFVDLDNDNDKDIVAGALNGTIYCYINNGTSFTQNTTFFAGIDVGWQSAPAFADIDTDGDPDMIIGAEDGPVLQFYRNDGGNVFVQDNSFITGVTSVRNGTPTFVDLDRDGDSDLVIGGINGRLLYYQNSGTIVAPSWTRNDAVLAELTVRQDATPGFADFNGDGKADVILGEYSGNFSYYKNQMPTSAADNLTWPASFSLNQNYPNPFNPSTQIQFAIPTSGNVELKVFDMLGREVATLVNEELMPGAYVRMFSAKGGSASGGDATGLASGVYLYRLKAENFSRTMKMVVVR